MVESGFLISWARPPASRAISAYWARSRRLIVESSRCSTISSSVVLAESSAMGEGPRSAFGSGFGRTEAARPFGEGGPREHHSLVDGRAGKGIVPAGVTLYKYKGWATEAKTLGVGLTVVESFKTSTAGRASGASQGLRQSPLRRRPAGMRS